MNKIMIGVSLLYSFSIISVEYNAIKDSRVFLSNTEYGLVSYQNKRPYQEDRYFIDINENSGKFFGIYDGHGGYATSSYLAEMMHTLFFSCSKDNQINQDVFECAFKKAEEHIVKNCDDGSTAVVAYIDKDNNLYCGWTGDTRLVVEKNGVVDFYTQDHKPARVDEKKRIERAGGKIKKKGVWRINGLAVSRSLGDVILKKMGEGQIIAVPEYASMKLDSNNHFMIVASDGLWDVMSNQEAIDIVKKELDKAIPKQSVSYELFKQCAQSLQDEALKRKSTDNITICVVKLNWSGADQLIKEQKSRIVRLWNWLRGVH